MSPDTRRAAIIATGITLPLVVVVALLLGTLTGGKNKADPTAPVRASTPPHATQFAAACTTMLTALPTRLGRLPQRLVTTTPSSPFVLAWGDPAIVVSCGVDRPKGFGPGAGDELFPGGSLAGAWYWVDRPKGENVYTAIDRAAYVSLSLPDAYQGSDYLPTLNAAVLKAFPKAVCSTDASAPVDALCTRRRT